MTLERDPDRARAWEQRSRERARATGWQSREARARRRPLPQQSERSRERSEQRGMVRDLVFARDGRCLMDHLPGHRCSGAPLTPHHLFKAGRGGGYTVDNLVTLCAGANTWVEDHPTDAATLGLVVGWVRAEGTHVDHEAAARRRELHGLLPRRPL